jgi:DNA-binding NarL/FixJ family response regulator
MMEEPDKSVNIDPPKVNHRITRMLVVDDNRSFLHQVCARVALGDRPGVVSAANSVTDAKRVMDMGDFDVALVDATLPDGSGLEVLSEIMRRRPGAPLMMVAVFGDKAKLLASLEAASMAFAREDEESVSLPSKERIESLLSEREIEVLLFLAKGNTTAEVARLLELSAHTVATHVKHIYRKLGVHNKSACIYEATRAGLVT